MHCVIEQESILPSFKTFVNSEVTYFKHLLHNFKQMKMLIRNHFGTTIRTLISAYYVGLPFWRLGMHSSAFEMGIPIMAGCIATHCKATRAHIHSKNFEHNKPNKIKDHDPVFSSRKSETKEKKASGKFTFHCLVWKKSRRKRKWKESEKKIRLQTSFPVSPLAWWKQEKLLPSLLSLKLLYNFH